MKTLQVVGYKNSGKTTLIARWIRLLKKRGLTVAVMKHHGHHEALDLPDAQTDGVQFFNSGADVSVVSGADSAQILLNEEPDFEQLKRIATYNNPDVLLIEGFKNEAAEKVVLLREEADWQSLQKLSNIQLIASYDKLEIQTNDKKYLSLDNIDEWFLTWVQEEADETI